MADILKRGGMAVLGEGILADQIARTERARSIVRFRLRAEAAKARDANRKARLKRKRERRKAARAAAASDST